MRLVRIVAIAVPVLVVGGLGAGFLSLCANALPPEQTTVHKDFPAGRFAVTQAAQAPAASLASAMPPPAAAPVAGAAMPPQTAASKGTATSPTH